MVQDIPDNILDYPLVQYIPLRLYNQLKGEHNFSSSYLYITIYNSKEEDKLNRKISNYELPQDNYKIEKDYLAVLIFNGNVNLIKYRGYEVFMIGSPKKQHIHLFKVTTRYFYKNRLIFTLYDNQTGNRLKRERFNLKKSLWV